MIFNEYYERWNKHGIKLISGFEITEEILDMVSQQSEICDLIWTINYANQNNKSVVNLSYTVMDQIRKLSPSLLNHKGCKNYSGVDEIEKRAIRHYTTDPIGRFIKRQEKIKKVIEVYTKRIKASNLQK